MLRFVFVTLVVVAASHVVHVSEAAPHCPLDQTETVYLPHEMTSLYYSCAHGITTIEVCPQGTGFDPDKLECVPSPLVEPTAFQCPTNSSELEVFIDPDDCRTWYFCIDGIAMIHHCNEGFEFDLELWTCVLVSDNGCTASRSTPSSPAYTTTTADAAKPKCLEDENCRLESRAGAEGDQQLARSPVSGHRVQCSGDSLSVIPDDEECDKFYVCFGGTVTEYRCDSGHEFDPVSLMCVPITDSGCTASKTTTTSFTPTFGTDAPTTSRPFNCPTVSTNVVMYPDPDDCARFYVCFLGQATEYVCLSGHEFSPQQGQCVPISDEGCTAQKTTAIPQTTWGPIYDCPISDTISFHVDPVHCDIYYLCFRGSSSIYYCPAGFEFDEGIVGCLAISATGCTASRYPTTTTTTEAPGFSCPTSGSQVTFHGDPDNCGKFYICFAGLSSEHYCDDGFEFDETSKTCSLISGTGCSASKTTSLPTTRPPPFSCPTTGSTISFHPNPKNCAHFYICIGGLPSEYFCDEGYEFDEIHQDCLPIWDECDTSTYMSTDGSTITSTGYTPTDSSSISSTDSSTPTDSSSISSTDSSSISPTDSSSISSTDSSSISSTDTFTYSSHFWTTILSTEELTTPTPPPCTCCQKCPPRR